MRALSRLALALASAMPAKLFVKKLSDAASLPKRGSELAAGWDLAASQPVVVPARGKAIVPTDLAVATPGDCYARIAPLGGLAVKKGVDGAPQAMASRSALWSTARSWYSEPDSSSCSESSKSILICHVREKNMKIAGVGETQQH